MSIYIFDKIMNTDFTEDMRGLKIPRCYFRFLSDNVMLLEQFCQGSSSISIGGVKIGQILNLVSQ